MPSRPFRLHAAAAISSCRCCNTPTPEGATTCSACGARDPSGATTRKRFGQFFIGYAAVALLVGLASVFAQPRTPAKPVTPPLNTSGIVEVKVGTPVCVSEFELEAYQKGAPARCDLAPVELPVVVVSMSGIIDRVADVRPITGPGVIDLWVPYAGLKNG